MIGIVRRRMPINRTGLRKDSAPVTTAVGGFIGGRVPFTPRLLSSAVVARLCRLSSFLRAFHATLSANQSNSGKKTRREEREGGESDGRTAD